MCNFFLNGNHLWPTFFVKIGFFSSWNKEKMLIKLYIQRTLSPLYARIYINKLPNTITLSNDFLSIFERNRASRKTSFLISWIRNWILLSINSVLSVLLLLFSNWNDNKKLRPIFGVYYLTFSHSGLTN